MDTNDNDFDESALPTGASKTRHRWISVAAYYKSEARGFAPGLELDDWLAAEKEYIDALISSYLTVIEEDGAMTVVGLRQLAEAIGVPETEQVSTKADLIRAIQSFCSARPCFQTDPGSFCQALTGCQWKTQCLKMIAVWKR